MPITATLDPTLARRPPARGKSLERLLEWLLPARTRPAEQPGTFAASMTTFGAQDPVLFAAWLQAEENLAEDRSREG